MARPRVVVDANIWISYLFFAKSNILEVGDFLVSGDCTVVASGNSLNELLDVLKRAEWDRYLSLETRLTFYQCVYEVSESTATTSTITTSRDPKDNELLNVAHDGQADYLVTGDNDLLTLAEATDPDWSFRIVTPANFLESLRSR